MTKELRIKTIKEDLVKALLEDVRIINAFSNKQIKKTKEYVGNNIYGYLDDKANVQNVDTYINLDVMKNKNCYDVFIHLKAHRDLLGNGITTRLDDVSECIEEIVNDLYPYHRCYSDIPECIADNFMRRNIRFVLSPKDMEKTSKNNDETEIEETQKNIGNWHKAESNGALVIKHGKIEHVIENVEKANIQFN